MGMRRVVVGVLLLVAACTDSDSSPPQTTSAATTTTAVPTTIAAGLDAPIEPGPGAAPCSEIDGDVVTINDTDHVSIPRCLIVRGDDRLSVHNTAKGAITVTLGTHYRAEIPAGGSHTFSVPLTRHLAPGMHVLEVRGENADTTVEIWVK